MPNSKSIWTTSKNESQSVIDSAVEGDRVYVTTDKNNNFIDATSIYGTSILGYGNKKIAHAIFDKLMKLVQS
jgi:adenosylmethionine-8-amino-7-oxononanoate aminotransferase